MSYLQGSTLNASRAALAAALADNEVEADPVASNEPQTGGDNGDDGEPQEVNMETQAEEIKTVFNDPQRFNVKHPLYSSWTLWFDSPATKGRNLPQTPSASFPQTPSTPTPAAAAAAAASGGWMDDIKRVISFDSVEEFWGLHNNIVPPSHLPPKANYYLFKEGIIPAWEDEANKNGGKWSIQLPKEKNRTIIDKMWLYTMLAAIGETFDLALAESKGDSTEEPASLVTGVIVSSRPQFFRISIWTRLAPTAGGETDPLRQRIEGIGHHFKESVLGYGRSQKLAGPLATEVEFQNHKDSEKKGKGKKIIV